jgi:Zn finger protein HypA/HybF involved in hydrogenase expression
MGSNPTDTIHSMMLDGNAAAGILSEIFALEITSSSLKCANCGREGEMGTLLAFMQAPGVILRCPVCKHVNLRVVQTPETIYLDFRGVVFIALNHDS